MSQLTTHVLDTSCGKPAEGIQITLFEQTEKGWQKIAEGITNDDGRIAGLLKADHILKLGAYKIVFQTEAYFKKQKITGFYPYVPIIFEITDASHYHVPLLLNPYGYSTYRGS